MKLFNFLRRFAVVAAIAIGTCQVSTAQPDATILAIEKAWKQQQERLSKVSVRWDQQVTAHKGSRTDDVASVKPNVGIFPPTNRTYPESMAFVLDGDKVRYEHDGKSLHPDKLDWTEDKFTLTYDGSASLQISRREVGKSFYHTASRDAGELSYLVRSTATLPMMHGLRPLNPMFSLFRLDDYRVTGRKSVLRGRECIELNWQFKEGYGKASVFRG